MHDPNIHALFSVTSAVLRVRCLDYSWAWSTILCPEDPEEVRLLLAHVRTDDGGGKNTTEQQPLWIEDLIITLHKASTRRIEVLNRTKGDNLHQVRH